MRLCGDRVIRQLARGPRGFEAGILGRLDRIGTAGESIGGREMEPIARCSRGVWSVVTNAATWRRAASSEVGGSGRSGRMVMDLTRFDGHVVYAARAM